MNSRIDDMDFSKFDSPVDVELHGIVEEFDGDIDDIINDAELMGVDINDPILMAGFIKKMMRRIKKRVRAKRKRKRKRRDFSITTPEGGLSITREGLSLTRPVTGLPPTPAAEGIQAMLKNPLMLAIPAGLVLILLLKKKRRPAPAPAPAPAR